MSTRVPSVAAGRIPAPAANSARRPARRALRALLALAVAAAGLALAAGPAHGAAAVVTVDRLSGGTRYETAVDIAKEYADAIVDRRRPPIDTIILTSGEDAHFGCALPAPALSRLHEAPLLLTKPSSLSNGLRRFIKEYDIDRAFVVGGTDIVSDAVYNEVKSLNNVEMKRISGGDCYGTAVEVAELVGTAPGEPGRYLREGRTALLATGEVFADALAAGPLAYSGQHPILLTPRGTLDSRVKSFLDDSDTEHVIILGGPAAVATSVERGIQAMGISVDRLYGADRYATAVRVAQELLGDSPPQACFAGDEIGLAYGRRSPDAITSGPLLGEKCAPLLLTDLRELPLVADDFLGADEYVVGDSDGDLLITIFGGTSAVARSAENDAVNAARLREIRATVTGTEGACFFTVTFSEPVRTSDANTASGYTLGGQALSSSSATVDAGSAPSTTEATVVLGGAQVSGNASVPSGCAVPLGSRERIGVADKAIRAANDRRTVRQAEATVRADNTRPSITVVAPEGSREVTLEFSEPVKADNFVVTFTRDRVDATSDAYVLEGETRMTFAIPYNYDDLDTGDRITIPSGAVEDLAGNTSLRTTLTIRRDDILPRVSRVTVTVPVARAAASVLLNGEYRGSLVTGVVKITARSDGAVRGAAGNEWDIEVVLDDSVRSGDASRVEVDSSAKRIRVTAALSTQVPHLVDDLNRDPAFRSLFEADLTDHHLADDAMVDDMLTAMRFSGGVSTVDLAVWWTEPVRGCDATDRPLRPGYIEIDTNANGVGDFGLDGVGAAASNVQFVTAPDGNRYIVAGRAACDLTSGVPSGTLVARVSSTVAAELPTVRSRAIVFAGAAYDIKGNPAANQQINSLRRP